VSRKLHNFNVNKHLPAEQWERPGKPDWQDYVYVTISRARAFDLVRDILAQVRDGEETVELPLFGELSERIE
jgi:hypothetical protein